ncbi:MAG: hypothetical protein J7524_01970 [Roseofilum sp. Belize BBD 4]|uniref:hypothetical protein n=1 Tax=Roseofilum sp. Belize BBD 4 TaxID=2821500 RepID=UPI001B276CE3|nr:hypothetical protein [Roseofilum sp. Belize BBD 4]MBP0031919.1 hypothetical protein [Roseofilum sp. Belize BBD 4]
MNEPKAPEQNRSIYVGGDVTGSPLATGDGNSIVIGDGNQSRVEFQQAPLPKPETVHIIFSELKAIEEIFTNFNDPIATGVAQKLASEAEKPELDPSIVAETLDTGLNYIQKLSGFAEKVNQLKPHVEATASWLGEHGHKLLPLVGLGL